MQRGVFSSFVFVCFQDFLPFFLSPFVLISFFMLFSHLFLPVFPEFLKNNSATAEAAQPSNFSPSKEWTPKQEEKKNTENEKRERWTETKTVHVGMYVRISISERARNPHKGPAQFIKHERLQEPLTGQQRQAQRRVQEPQKKKTTTTTIFERK